MFSLFKKTILIFAALILLAPQLSLAQNLQNAFSIDEKEGPVETVAKTSGYDTSSEDVNYYIGYIISTIISFVGVIFLILTIYAGYLWMMAKGDEAQITKAKGILTTAITGLAIVLLAYAITFYIFNIAFKK